MIKKLRKIHSYDSVQVGILLALVGGFLEVYTYALRGGVFANAQTGNIVFFMLNLSKLQWIEAIYCLAPIISYFMGVVVTEWIKLHDNYHKYVLLLEIVLLFLIAFYPLDYPSLVVTMIISFICAMQVSSFNKLTGTDEIELHKGAPYTTTMCTGNLRSAAEQFTRSITQREREAKIKFYLYMLIILSFGFGVIIGSVIIEYLNIYSIWCCCLCLIIVLWKIMKEESRDKQKAAD